MILELLADALGWVIGGGRPVLAIAVLLLVAVEGRRVVRVGGLAASGLNTVVMTALALAALLAVGVLTLDVGVLLGLVQAGAELVVEVLS